MARTFFFDPRIAYDNVIYGKLLERKGISLDG
jgi:hypothetical protein